MQLIPVNSENLTHNHRWNHCHRPFVHGESYLCLESRQCDNPVVWVCKHCQFVSYCSEQCAQLSWPIHRLVCGRYVSDRYRRMALLDPVLLLQGNKNNRANLSYGLHIHEPDGKSSHYIYAIPRGPTFGNCAVCLFSHRFTNHQPFVSACYRGHPVDYIQCDRCEAEGKTLCHVSLALDNDCIGHSAILVCRWLEAAQCLATLLYQRDIVRLILQRLHDVCDFCIDHYKKSCGYAILFGDRLNALERPKIRKSVKNRQ